MTKAPENVPALLFWGDYNEEFFGASDGVTTN